MNLISKGYWYNVFDLGNGRVRKIEKPILQKVRDVYYFENKKILSSIAAIYRLLTCRKEVLHSYARIRNIDLSLVGNPVFLPGTDYEQDKVKTLGDAINNATQEEQKKYIDAYINNIIECWKSGFADKIYNFTINNGVAASGQVILLDFNEITFLKDKVSHAIQLKRWLKAWSVKQIDSSLQLYYQAEMDRLITQGSLDKNWAGK